MKKTLPFLLLFLSSIVFANNNDLKNTEQPQESTKSEKVKIIITQLITQYDPEKAKELIQRLTNDKTIEETVKKLKVESKGDYAVNINPNSKGNINYIQTTTHSYISEIVSKKDINNKEIIETVYVSSITEGIKVDINIYKYDQKTIDFNIDLNLKKLLSMRKEGNLELPTSREESFNQRVSLPFNQERMLNARYSNLDNNEYTITLIKIVKE